MVCVEPLVSHHVWGGKAVHRGPGPSSYQSVPSQTQGNTFVAILQERKPKLWHSEEERMEEQSTPIPSFVLNFGARS